MKQLFLIKICGIFLLGLFLSFFCLSLHSAAKEEACRLSYAEMYIASDPGHGGSLATHIVERRGPNAASRVERVEETRFPIPGHEEGFKRTKKTTPIAKDGGEVESFFVELEGLKIMSWKDHKTDAVPLHPTSYHFTFRDSCGRENKFEYSIEGSRRFDKEYDSLVEKFEGLTGTNHER